MKKLNYDKQILIKVSGKQFEDFKQYAIANNKSLSEVVRTAVTRTIVKNTKKQ